MSRRRLVVVVLDDVLPLDLAIPMHVFAREAPEAYDVATASLDGRPVPVSGGMSAIPDGGLDLVGGAPTGRRGDHPGAERGGPRRGADDLRLLRGVRPRAGRPAGRAHRDHALVA